MPTERPARVTDQPTPEQMGLDEREVAWRKAFMRLTDADAQRLVAHAPVMHAHADAFIDALYGHLLAHDETRAFFRDPRTLGHARTRQHEYFLQLTGGEYGREYVRSRAAIGLVHQRIGVPLKAYFGAYLFYLESLARTSLGAAASPPPPAPAPGSVDAPAASADASLETFLSLLKLVFFDISLAIEAHVFQREQTILAQQRTIRELSTPVLRVRDRLLIVPLIGALDTSRSHQLSDQLLRAIREHRARAAVIDLTGVAVVDSAVANDLIKTVQSARLMGARVIITGISTEIAQTLVRIGIDLSQLDTMNDLQAGIAEAEQFLDRERGAIAGRASAGAPEDDAESAP